MMSRRHVISQVEVMQVGHLLTVTHRGTARFDAVAYTHTGSPGVSTRQGPESDVYDCLVCIVLYN